MKLYLVQKFNRTPYIQAKDPLWLEYIQIITGNNFSNIANVCDVNCGNGKMLCALAFLYPNIRFTGISLNLEDKRHAVKIKSALNLQNIDFFYAASISEIPSFYLPPQSLVFLHNIWNFCDEEERKTLSQFANTSGITIVSYDALPGHASLIAIHHTLVKNNNAGKTLHYINQHYGSYFQAHPVAGVLMNEDMNRYMHPKWHPQSVEQLSEYFSAPLKGEFPVYKNYPYVGMSKEEKELFSQIKDPLYFSAMKDYTFNTTNRTDIFANPLSKKGRNFSDLSFGQITSHKSFPNKIVKGRITFFYQKQIFQDIFKKTKHGFVPYIDVKESLPQCSDYELTKAIHELVAGEVLQVSLCPYKTQTTITLENFNGKIKFTHPFNEYISQNTPLEGNIFINPETKTIIPVEGMECALLQALTKVTLPLAAQLCAANFIKNNPQNHLLGKNHKQITNNFLIALDRLKNRYLPKLVEMNMVEILG